MADDYGYKGEIVNLSDIFIDSAVMPDEWSEHQHDDWVAWARQHLQMIGSGESNWTPEVVERPVGHRGPYGQPFVLMGFTENGEPRGYAPR